MSNENPSKREMNPVNQALLFGCFIGLMVGMGIGMLL